MLLDIKLDAYVIKLPDFNVTNPTLTTVLFDHSQIWDIVGFVEPVRVLSKLFINKLHAAKLGWKGKLNSKQIEEWKNVTQMFKLNVTKSFQRCVSVNTKGQHSLHIFTDASDIGFGVVAYVVSHNIIKTSRLLCAKSKLKKSNTHTTIPRLELCGILFGLELGKKLINISGEKY